MDSETELDDLLPGELRAGTLLDNRRFEIVRRIGKGGFGFVYEAKDLSLLLIVAIKQSIYHDVKALKAFEGEARILASLQHPNLPRVIRLFTEGRSVFFAMDFIPGPDLGQMLIDGERFSSEQVYEIGRQLLGALDYMHNHERKVIHRDIKPRNVKLHNGMVMLLDFGLSKSGDDSTIHRGSKSPHYSPPEQGLRARTTPQTDFYSLGATLYHLVTGEKPPDAIDDRFEAVANGQPDPLETGAHRSRQDVSAGMAALIDRAMSLVPEARFGSSKEMLRELQGVHHLDLAGVLFEKGEFGRAVEEYNRAGEIRPDDVEVYIGRGKARLENNEYDLTIADLTKAAELNPEDARPHVELGWAHAKKARDVTGDYGPAVAAMTRAVELQPDDSGVYLQRALVHREAGYNESAIADLQKVLELPEKEENYHDLARKRLAELFEYNAKGQYERGEEALRNKDYELAVEHFTKALELKPDYTAAYVGRGRARFSCLEYDSAIADLTKSIELEPENVEVYIERAKAYMSRATSKRDVGSNGPDLIQYENAVADFSQALNSTVADASTYAARAEAYVALRKWEYAIADLDEAISFDPDRPSYYSRRGELHGIQGAHDLAVADFNRALELEPDNGTLYRLRAQAYLRLSDSGRERAVEDLKNFRDLSGKVVLTKSEKDLLGISTPAPTPREKLSPAKRPQDPDANASAAQLPSISKWKIGGCISLILFIVVPSALYLIERQSKSSALRDKHALEERIQKADEDKRALEERAQKAEQDLKIAQARLDKKAIWWVATITNKTQDRIKFSYLNNAGKNWSALAADAGQGWVFTTPDAPPVIKYESGVGIKEYKLTSNLIIGHYPNDSEKAAAPGHHFARAESGLLWVYPDTK